MNSNIRPGSHYELLRKPYPLQLLTLSNSSHEISIITNRKSSSYITNKHNSNMNNHFLYKTAYTFMSGVTAGILTTIIQHKVTNYLNTFKTIPLTNILLPSNKL